LELFFPQGEAESKWKSILQVLMMC
jgi:hypothetical protein